MTEPLLGDEEETRPPQVERSTRNLLLEGLVIIASILLAFAIDAGWDELREREQEERLLMQLAEELELFIDNLGPASKRVTDRVNADVSRLLDCVHASEVVARDEWLEALGWLHRTYQFSSATPVIDLLTADGGLQLISDSAIREELSSVSSFLGIVKRFEELQGQFVTNEMIPWLNRNLDRYAIWKSIDPDWTDRVESRFESDLAALRTREFSNLLVERDRLLYLVVLFRTQTLERMKNLREMVRERTED